MRPAVFLDRDGTLIVERNYLCDPAGVELLPGAVEGLAKLKDHGFLLVVLTNQAGVGRGFFSEEDVGAVHARLRELLAREGISLDGIYYCPHHPAVRCACRKPEPGMYERAVRELGIDPGQSVIIGDKPSDIDLGHTCGLLSVLVRTGYGAGHEKAGDCSPSHVADDLRDAAAWIVEAFPDPKCL